MKDKKKIYILLFIAIFVILLFLFQGLNENNFKYNLYKRIPKVLAIILTGGAIAFSSIIFQTITNNRILTPSILGLDALYGFLQTLAVFIFGASSIVMTSHKVNFIITMTLMILSTLILYKVMFKNGKNNIFFLLLVGTVLGTLFKSLSTFMQVLIDPNEFEALQGKLFASFSNVNTDILLVVVIIMLLVFAFIYDDLKKLDVMLLGRDTSINLGIDYNKLSKKILLVVSVLVSISTALVGSITFLGLIVVNVSYEMFKTFKHSYLILGAMLISIIALVGGQFFVERILNYNSTVSIIINFIGGIYFIYLLLKENKR
ncbi:iron chelate uptake ABC transporter family permease subunit [Clostridium frigidicarnis]|uniref:Iron complex transport system permease protein n=1 Tax=Clostridium frigidicarnis TaxID=84698 RepID=A0A1I0XHP7_9CLOT|nr:iron chelate uptake ABC transporter family permease subunit [Clostridium frigidicarnis]SFB00434.1 iron complex transport system permease protein [Clostridium frigidicarnis]